VTDLALPPGRGLPDGLVIPDAELVERFSRSSGPGGQSVNTTDSRVELRWDVAASGALSDTQRARLLERLGGRLVDGALTIAASEHRSQLQNRTAARARLAMLLTNALAPPPPARRATRPSRAAKQRRVDAKRRRGELKATRSRPRLD
jgi:ribosome-associated protein